MPYGVKICYIYNGEECISTIEKIDIFGYIWDNYNGCYHIREIKPYLLPLSSMTEEQKKEFELLFDLNYASAYSQELQIAANMIKWLNKNHFDIYGLIPMGLANDATNLNIY